MRRSHPTTSWLEIPRCASQQIRSPDRLGVGGALKDAIGGALGKIRAELLRAIEEQQRSFEAKLAEHKERLLAVPDRLPVAKFWQPDSVTYEAQVV